MLSASCWDPLDNLSRKFVLALVSSRLHYGHSTLVHLPSNVLRQLQEATNSRARLRFGVREEEHNRNASSPSASLVSDPEARYVRSGVSDLPISPGNGT